MKKIILINLIILLSIYLYGQKDRFSAGLLFSPEINWYEDRENNKKLSVNFRYGVLAEFKINDYIFLQSGINHIKQTYNIHRIYDHCDCAFNEPGEPCPEVLRYVNKTEYYLITIPINIKFIKLSDDKRISPFVLLNINNNIHFLGKYYPDDGSNVDKLKKVKYFGNTGSIDLGIEYLLCNRIKMDLSAQLRIIEYRKKDPIVFEKEDQIKTFNNAGLSISILYSF
jgi:hypothetical protein